MMRRGPVPPVGGIVLCGGRSRRMGVSKAWLRLDGVPMLIRVVRVVDAAVSRTVCAAGVDQAIPDLPDGVGVVRDASPDIGPLSGMLSGIEELATDCDSVFVVACDLPRMTTALIELLFDALGDSEAAVPVLAGRVQPLAGVYRVTVADTIRAMLAAGERRATALVESLACRRVELSDDLSEVLQNINTREAFRALGGDRADGGEV